MKLEATAFQQRGSGCRLFTTGPGTGPSPRARAKVELEQLELHSCPSAFCLQKELMLQFFSLFFFFFFSNQETLHYNSTRADSSVVGTAAQVLGQYFWGQDLNMGTGTGIKSSRNKFVQHSATLRICVSGDIEAAHGDEIIANESKTGN